MKQKGKIEPWVYKAEEDYRTTVTMARKRKGGAPDVVCFCSHQCIEKYLKAFSVFHRISFPKTHVLDALLDLAVEEAKNSVKLMKQLRAFLREKLGLSQEP